MSAASSLQGQGHGISVVLCFVFKFSGSNAGFLQFPVDFSFDFSFDFCFDFGVFFCWFFLLILFSKKSIFLH